MSLTRLIYLSQSTLSPDATGTALAMIRDSAGRNNPAVGVTGLLLYSGGYFLQLIEGDDVAVLRLYDLIASDPRHTSVERLIFQPTDERLFAHWDMGVMNLDAAAAVDRRRFAALAAACRNSSGSEQLARLYGEFRRQLAGVVCVAGMA